MLLLGTKQLHLLLLTTLYHGLSVASPKGEYILKNSNTRGAVASESQECSRIGTYMLEIGGNAVDAIVATTFCVGVVAGYHSGIGGGGFMMVRDKEGGYEAIDFREAAPEAAYTDMYKHNVKGSIIGGLSVGVPSEVRGLEYVHKKHGVLPWKAVLEGAIKVARDGFKVNADMEMFIRNSVTGSNWNFLAEDPAWAEDFVIDGRLVELDQIMTRKRYAKTLETIAEKGADAFYTGEIAKHMIKSIQDNNGTMTLDDLKDYQVISRPVLNITFHGYNLFGMGAPASGAVTFNILKTIEKLTGDRDQTIHNYVEAMKFAYGARYKLGDPDFVAEMDELQEQMLDEETAQKIREKIDPNSTLPIRAYDPKGIYTTTGHGTSQIATADSDGMAVTLTTTVNLIWGSQLMDPVTGVIFNNEMNDFSIPDVPNEFGFQPSTANFIKPSKRPLSSITPVIVAHPDGTFFAAVGAAGGSRIISATTQTLFHIINDGVDIKWAVHEPRLHDQLLPNTLLVEKRFNVSTVTELKKKHHNVTWVPEGLSAVHAVQWDNGFKAGNDPRQKNSGGFVV